jgi:hypothetical protein
VRLVALFISGVALLGAAACASIDSGQSSAASRSDARPSSGSASASLSIDAPAACLPSAEAGRGSVEGTPTWVRFCPGADGLTVLAEVPSDALTTHLDLLSGLTGLPADSADQDGCRADSSRTYRVQVGYADGRVAEIRGATDPGCVGTMAGSRKRVRGPVGLGVYGAVMSAFGQLYADSYDSVGSRAPLVCPVDPREPGSVDHDGASASLDTGWHLGKRVPMVMPLAAVRGIVCTWSNGEREPAMRDLTVEQAERVRIGLHAIFNAMVDCAGSPEPTYSAVVQDKTGTRRAVTIVDSECSTVIRSDGGFGLGFPWLHR